MEKNRGNSREGNWAEAAIYKEKLAACQSLLAEEKEKFLAQQQMLEMTSEHMQALQDQLEESRQSLIKQNNYINDSINYAQRIQAALQPGKKHIDNIFPGHFVLLLAKDKLSGDIHWFYNRGNVSLAAAIDCTGHGIPGAMLTMIVTSLLNEIVSTKADVFDPAQILTELDLRLYAIIHNQENEMQIDDGLDVSLVSYDKHTKRAVFAGAHRPLYLFTGGKLERIKGARTGLGSGKAKQCNLKNHEIRIQEGDKLYIFSDGFPDQFGGDSNTKYMIGRFRQLLARIAIFPPEDQKKILEDEFFNWKGSYPQTDDVLIICLTF